MHRGRIPRRDVDKAHRTRERATINELQRVWCVPAVVRRGRVANYSIEAIGDTFRHVDVLAVVLAERDDRAVLGPRTAGVDGEEHHGERKSQHLRQHERPATSDHGRLLRVSWSLVMARRVPRGTKG